MTKCLDAGDLNANGPCTLFTDVNANGLNMYECSEFTFVPAACPDDSAKGTINAGSAQAKIASVDGSVPDVCVQRDASGVGYAENFTAKGFDVVSDTCPVTGTSTQVRADHVSIGPLTPDGGTRELRLRGNGDFAAYGGSTPDNQVGVLAIRRLPGTAGQAQYINYGFPLAGIGSHLFGNNSVAEVSSQSLMELSPTAGTLYFPAWTYVSDVRLKSDVVEIDGKAALEVVMGISPITYSMHGRRYSGFSAQNVQTVLPDAVNLQAEGTKQEVLTLRDGDIVAQLLAAVKHLSQRVEQLEAKLGA